MPQTISDPKLVIQDLLRTGWDNTNVPVGLDADDIHTGWYDDGKGFPQVAISNRNEYVSRGGESGFSAISGDGSGGIQNRNGTVLVTSFGGSREDYDEVGLERFQTEEMATEVSRILSANQSPGEYLMLSVGSREDLIDTDSNPTEYAVQFQIRYSWMKQS